MLSGLSSVDFFTKEHWLCRHGIWENEDLEGQKTELDCMVPMWYLVFNLSNAIQIWN